MKLKTIFLILTVGLAMAPSLFATETTETADLPMPEGTSVSAIDASDETQADAAPITNGPTEPAAGITADVELPVAPVTQLSASFAGETCIACSVHADCESVCGGGAIYFDYRCQWSTTCTPRLKQCWCS